MSAATKQTVTANDLTELLRARYPIPSWALITEVPNATSTGKTRSADALAIGCWKSVGIQMHGFEIKVARSDWLREIQDPSKALPFQKHCHHWWIVAAPKVVRVEEMPAEWGLNLSRFRFSRP